MASNIIVLTRGDSYSFDITVFDENDPYEKYEFGPEDTIYFGLMFPHQKFEDAIVRKKYVVTDSARHGRIIINITPDDTVDLDPGVYYYAVKLKSTLTTGQTAVNTIINKTKFIIND